MNTAYGVKFVGGDVFATSSAIEELEKVDVVVFDCDGTLIDVSRSYDAAIVKTATSMIRAFLGRPLLIERVSPRLIQEVRRTGGFNSDWDMTYALSMFSVAASDVSGSADSQDLIRLENMVVDFTSKERMGWKSVDKYLESSGLWSGQVKGMREFLGYPGSPLQSRMTQEFDRLYYGSNLFRRIYGAWPKGGPSRGLIDLERLIVTRESLDAVARTLGKKRIAMATGRPFVAVEYTMGRLLKYFDRKASVYIGDGDISPELAPSLAKYKKPSGKSLMLARKELQSEVMLYVGDSAEDRLMVKNAGAPPGAILFAGIYGTSFNDKEQISYFTATESDIVAKDVNQVVKVLEMVKN